MAGRVGVLQRRPLCGADDARSLVPGHANSGKTNPAGNLVSDPTF